jgi:hypothetical protein
MSKEDTENPYAAPQDFVTAEVYPPAGSPFVTEPTSTGLWRQGQLLVMDKYAQLPGRCVKSNEPSTKRLKRNLYWHHPAVYLAIFAHLLIYIILALILRKTATIHIGLSDRWFTKRRRTILIAWGLVLLSIGLFVFGIMNVDKTNDALPVWMILGGLCLFLGGLLYGLIASRMVVAKRIDDRYVWLKGVHPDFLADLPDWPHP